VPHAGANLPGWPTTREHPNGTTVLVMGILSIAACGILGPFAWKMGNSTVREMDAQPDVLWTNRGNINAGRICGIIGSVFLALGALMFALWLIFAIVVFAGGV